MSWRECMTDSQESRWPILTRRANETTVYQSTWTSLKLKYRQTINLNKTFKTPAAISIEIFPQKLRDKEMDLDDTLYNRNKETWKKVTQDLNKLSTVQLPRFIGNGTSQLLSRSHSSNKAYATIIYLRIVNNWKAAVNLILSKLRNVLKKKQTISSLELMSILIGGRSFRFIAKQANLNETQKILWTDSQWVVKWLKQKERNHGNFC